MSTRIDLVLSDALIKAIDRAAEEGGQGRADVLRKALTIFLVAVEGAKNGLTIGLVHPETLELETEFVGLSSPRVSSNV